MLAQLRSSGILQLGKVDRLYFEAGGGFSLVVAEKEEKGLSIIPPEDETFMSEQTFDDSQLVCTVCGEKKQYAANGIQDCIHEKFVAAMV